MATRPCRRCRQPKPADEFLLWDDPTARANDYATRRWCGDCLVAQGHVRARALATHRARPAAADGARLLRVADLTARLLAKANESDEVASAIRAAAYELGGARYEAC